MGKIVEICEQRKKYLQSYRILNASIKTLESIVKIQKDEKEKERENLESCTGGTYANENNEVILDLIKKIEVKSNMCKIILEKINQMDNEIEKNVFLLKYINGNTWEQISELIQYSQRQTYYIHNRALQHFAL